MRVRTAISRSCDYRYVASNRYVGTGVVFLTAPIPTRTSAMSTRLAANNKHACVNCEFYEKAMCGHSARDATPMARHCPHHADGDLHALVTIARLLISPLLTSPNSKTRLTCRKRDSLQLLRQQRPWRTTVFAGHPRFHGLRGYDKSVVGNLPSVWAGTQRLLVRYEQRWLCPHRSIILGEPRRGSDTAGSGGIWFLNT